MKLLIAIVLLLAVRVAAQTSTAKPKDSAMSHRAAGTFDVTVTPLEPYNKDDKAIGRLSLDKQFHGDLEGASKGEMLAFGTGAPGTSSGAVAIEKVTGKLAGRSGSFVLQHNAIMTKGTPDWSIVVVPDSGTAELAGISGNMQIIIESSKHSYVFDYSLPEK
jgi:hypothetical protein